MENARADSDYQLRKGADKALAGIVDEFRMLLIRQAKRQSGEGGIGASDLEAAYSRLGFPNRELADAQSIITQTLRENRVGEWVAYVMALLFFIAGMVLLGVGVFGSQDVGYRITSLVSGSVVELLLILPFRFAINTRRHNIAIRMLGILIDRTDDPKKLAAILKETFATIVTGNVNLDSRPQS